MRLHGTGAVRPPSPWRKVLPHGHCDDGLGAGRRSHVCLVLAVGPGTPPIKLRLCGTASAGVLLRRTRGPLGGPVGRSLGPGPVTPRGSPAGPEAVSSRGPAPSRCLLEAPRVDQDYPVHPGPPVRNRDTTVSALGSPVTPTAGRQAQRVLPLGVSCRPQLAQLRGPGGHAAPPAGPGAHPHGRGGPEGPAPGPGTRGCRALGPTWRGWHGASAAVPASPLE